MVTLEGLRLLAMQAREDQDLLYQTVAPEAEVMADQADQVVHLLPPAAMLVVLEAVLEDQTAWAQAAVAVE
jgi:hypothetical protein